MLVAIGARAGVRTGRRACRRGARYSMGTQGQGPTLVERGVPAAPPPAMITRARARTREGTKVNLNEKFLMPPRL